MFLSEIAYHNRANSPEKKKRKWFDKMLSVYFILLDIHMKKVEKLDREKDKDADLNFSFR